MLPYERVQERGHIEGEGTHQALGEIHYVRDSDGGYDSDEDPDEDLDI